MRSALVVPLALLWPDASPQQVRANLCITLHYLRSALGHADWVLYTDAKYAFNRSFPYSYDVEQFEQQAREGLRQRTPEPEHAQALLEAAVESYRGEYLDDMPVMDWFAERRDGLRRLYLESLFALGQLYTAQRDYHRALATFRQIITRDRYDEGNP